MSNRSIDQITRTVFDPLESGDTSRFPNVLPKEKGFFGGPRTKNPPRKTFSWDIIETTETPKLSSPVASTETSPKKPSLDDLANIATNTQLASNAVVPSQPKTQKKRVLTREEKRERACRRKISQAVLDFTNVVVMNRFDGDWEFARSELNRFFPEGSQLSVVSKNMPEASVDMKTNEDVPPSTPPTQPQSNFSVCTPTMITKNNHHVQRYEMDMITTSWSFE
jgi:hypothetical protein